MFVGAVDQVLKSLRIATEGHLSKCRHGQQTAQRVERLLFENAVLLVEVGF